MPLQFQQVPDWTSWENQGGTVTTADLDGDGVPELIVLRVDHPVPGPNRSFYRVGAKLQANGNVAGGWGPWMEIPDWGSNENQGAGIAVANFGAAGLGLVVFQVKHVEPGPNVGMFRVGRKLNAQGKVTGGWSNWQQVPNWISWRDQGAGIAIFDLAGDGKPDLFVFHIDDFHTGNGKRPNKGFYRVASNLADTGAVAAWGDWIEVDWFSWFNQGAGIAVADLDGNGRPEVIIFQIDNPPGENVGFYRVGWNLDQKGNVQDGWGPWTAFDGWGAAEDQGGGFALASFGAARPKAVAFHVASLPQLNQGLFAVTDLTLDIDQAQQKGVWRLLPYFSEVLPVHAALLHTGKVLFFAGSGNNAFRFQPAFLGNEAKNIFTSVVWDPASNVLDQNSFKAPATLRRADGSVVDFFCCGHSFLPDGRILVAGGSAKYDKKILNGQAVNDGGFTGTRDVLIFDPGNTKWTAVKPMAHGRWYPTVVTLSDGSVIVASGLDERAVGGDHNNDTLERNANPNQAAWVKTRDFKLPLYPHLFQLADGRLFYTGGKMDTNGASFPFIFDPINATNSQGVGGLTDTFQCNQCASVLLPPAQTQQYMILGGGPEDEGGNGDRGQATTRVATVAPASAQPAYQLKHPMNHERMHVNAVLLPDRTVIAVGGGVTREASARTNVVDPEGGREVFEAEIYDMTADKWTVTAPATVARLYHSVALLLPDGRVLAAGGNPDKGSQTQWLPPDPLEEERLEIFSPPYLFKKNTRPVIENVPQEIAYGAAIQIRTPQAPQVKWVSLIAPGLTTHSFNGSQRVVDVPLSVTSPNILTATIPNNRNVAPPGWYMLFLTDNDGVPSIATWVHLS